MSMQSPTQGTGPDEGDRKRRTEHRKAPKPEAVRELARRLRDAGQRERIEIDLSRTRVVRWTKPPWHTVACHGGSYALARREAVAEGYRLEFRPLEGDALLEYHPDERLSARFGCELWAIDATGEVNHKIHGNRGALALARDLGYEDSEALCQWAHENPRQWGQRARRCHVLRRGRLRRDTGNDQPEGHRGVVAAGRGSLGGGGSSAGRVTGRQGD